MQTKSSAASNIIGTLVLGATVGYAVGSLVLVAWAINITTQAPKRQDTVTH